ncbi:MAG: hypothetical protein QOK71_10690 [Nitrososphaeraceae archaeon]|nr:hypothetical protein [Nitrososphaeraceae archaeon]
MIKWIRNLSPIAISAEIKNYYNQVFKFVLEDYQSNVIDEKLSAVI